LSSGTQNRADGGEEAEAGSDDRVTRADARPFERQPQSICARRAADGMGHATFFRGSALKFRYLGAHNEFLRGEDGFYSLEQQRPDEAIFARKVENRYSDRHSQRGSARRDDRICAPGNPGRGSFFPVSHVRNVSTGRPTA